MTDAERIQMRRTQALIALTDEQDTRMKALREKFADKLKDAPDALVDKMLDIMEAYDWPV